MVRLGFGEGIQLIFGAEPIAATSFAVWQAKSTHRVKRGVGRCRPILAVPILMWAGRRLMVRTMSPMRCNSGQRTRARPPSALRIASHWLLRYARALRGSAASSGYVAGEYALDREHFVLLRPIGCIGQDARAGVVLADHVERPADRGHFRRSSLTRERGHGHGRCQRHACNRSSGWLGLTKKMSGFDFWSSLMAS